MSVSKGFKYTIYALIGTLIGLYIGLIILLNIPYIQKRTARVVAKELKERLHTDVQVGRINMGLLNRIVIDDVYLKDQQDNDLLYVNKLSAKFNILPLFSGKIMINSIQLFDFTAKLNRPTPAEPTNFQFVLDSFASKDTISKPFDLDIRVNSLLVRRGRIIYDVLSEPRKEGFDSNHVDLQQFIATVSLKALNKDSLNASIRRISFEEQSGFVLKKLSTKITANNNNLLINNFDLELLNSSLNLDSVTFTYPEWNDLKAMTDSVSYHGKLKSTLVPTDLSPFLATLQPLKTPVTVRGNVIGKGKDLQIPSLRIQQADDIQLHLDGNIKNWDQGSNAQVFARLRQIDINTNGLGTINTLLGQEAPILTRLEQIHVNGEIGGKLNDLHTIADMKTGIGEANGSIRIQSNAEHPTTYSGKIEGKEIHLGKILNNHQLGNASFSLDVESVLNKLKEPEMALKGIVSQLEYNAYEYENIMLDGLYRNGGFDGNISFDDPANGSIQLVGNINLSKPIPSYHVTAHVRSFRPYDMNLSKNYEDKAFSLNLKADVTGRTIDDMIGTIVIDSLNLSNPMESEYFLRNLTLTSTRIGPKEKELHVESPFLQAKVRGDYSYKTLTASVLHTIQRYIPSLVTLKQGMPTPHNHFDFEVKLSDATFFEKIFLIPIGLHYPATLSGTVNDQEEKLRIEGHFPEFWYKNTLYDSSNLLCESQPDAFTCLLRIGMLMKSGSMFNVAFDAKAKDDKLETIINWGNNTDVTYVGKLASHTQFHKSKGNKPVLSADIQIEPTAVVMNDTVWNVHPATILVDSGKVYVDNFLFEHENQHLRINGKLTPSAEDSCLIDLKNMDVNYILQMLRFDAVEFGGLATGDVNLKGVFGELDMSTRLNVHQFSVNRAIIGEADIRGKWDKELEGIRLTADMEEKDVSKTYVTGFVSPSKEGLDLHIQANNTNIGLLYPFIDGIFSQMDGRATGNIRLFGPLSDLDLEGDAVATANGFVSVLNTNFVIPNDSIHLRSGEISFNNVRIKDAEGHDGVANGIVRHNKLHNLVYHFDIQGNSLLLYNTQDTSDMTFYGKIYGTGNVTLDGGNNALTVTANMTTGPNTEFTYITGFTTEAISNQFITFVDKTPRRNQDNIQTHFYHPSDAAQKEEDDGPPMDLRMNMLIDATEDATVRIIMDPVTGDFISANGAGNLQINFYNKGDFRIFGDYVINRGIYKLSMQEIIRKDFSLNQGGTVTFSGDPGNANVDVQATYTVNSASLSDLGIGNLNQTQSTVRVNCLLNLTGNLSDPEIHFDLELPTVNEEDRELVRSITATEEQMNTQIIYLLGIGKFYTYDYTTASTQSNATSSLAFTTLSSQLNNILSQWMDNKNWNIGANLSTGLEGWTDVEAEAVLSGRLLNNRLLINGNFGYRDNALANTNFVGDFEAILLLTKNGEWRLRGYNETNDRYFIKSTLTTQGIGLIYKKDFDNWRELFKVFARKKSKEKTQQKIQEPENIPAAQQKREAWLHINEKK
ncbi:MAG: translocation/assembly module TamB [Phocaeicola sp.]|nr:translocation/assembly module TamB [Phocaeicola sp.]